VARLAKLFSRIARPSAVEAERGGAHRRVDVIVIGGGIAGLACARALGRQGRQVLILEARPRLGGRIHSAPFHGGPVDLGASWIHGRKRNPIVQLAEQAGVRLVRTDYESLELYDLDGRELKGREHDVIDRVVEQTMRELLRAKRGAARDASIAPIVERAGDQPGLSPAERRGVRWSIASEIASEYAADSRDLSLSQWDEDDEYGGGDCQLAGGYSAIVDVLAKDCSGLGVEIRTGTIVRSVDWSGREVRVQAGEHDHAAMQAVVTLPLGVLKQGAVEFRGSLPAGKQQAIGRLGIGTSNKVVMAFRARFWPKDADYFGCLNEADEMPMDFWNLEPVTGRPMLAALLGGKAAVRLEGMSDDEIRQVVLRPLRRAFGARVEEPLAWQVTRWSQDPFSLGAYSYVPPGATYEDYEAMAQPIEGRVLFAGEATNMRFPSTVHGAFESGERAAQQALR
jgi:polyamine oxidase